MTAARDLRPQLGAVRDQGPRGTCLAFAATAVHEQARRQRRGAWPDPLGEEILYWACKQLEADGHAGTSPWSVGEVLRDDGQSLAALWPYDPRRDESAPDYAPPPVAREVEQMCRATLRSINCRLEPLRTRINAGHAVILGVELWPNFYTAPGGELGTPDPLTLIGEAHALALAGYDDGAQELLLRNSWGPGWGHDGYGRLPYGALSIVARGAWTLEDDLDH